MTKKRKKNEGEVSQYFIRESHELIVPPEEYEMVQSELERRRGLGKHFNSKHLLSCKIVCSCCGGFFGKKIWHSNTPKYRKEKWQCNNHCKVPALQEKEIQQRSLGEFNTNQEIRNEIAETFSELSDRPPHMSKKLNDYISHIQSDEPILKEFDIGIMNLYVDHIVADTDGFYFEYK